VEKEATMQLEKSIRPQRSKVAEVASLSVWPLVATRTIPLAGRNARVRLEAEVWGGLDEIAHREGRAVTDLCRELDARRSAATPLTAEIRNYVLQYFRAA
jgi:predicted DNA-binding ribbon-helix-helix protein